ncbi:hypothetical protein CKY10_22495 [Photorhabdus sp. HUG-39]|nr:hypothetical protein CKY10_22495 [Photorhabdus sp. HUG-39]
MLGVERIGRHDNFFELGGHSLLIVSVIERLRLMNLHLDVGTVFAEPTLMAMAARVSKEENIAGEGVPENRIPGDTQVITPEMLPLIMLSQPEIDSIVTDVAGGAANIQDIYPLGPLQQGILFHYLLGGEEDPYLLHTIMAFDSRQRLDGFLAALQRVIDRHDILRSAVHWKGLPEPVQVVWRQAPLRVEELSLLAGEDAEQQLYQHIDPQWARLDVTRAPLMSASITQDSQSDEWLLALLSHHLVCDHLTLELMLHEIQIFIQQQEERLPHPLPYRNFIAQARSVPQTVHEAYFRQQLGDVDESTAPFGLLDVQGTGTLVVETRGYVETRLAQAVRDCARREGVSAAVLFHVAWAQVMAQCSGRDDVVFGTVLLGRSQGVAGADQVLGMFMNTLPVRVRLGKRSVWQVMRETYQHLSELLTHEQAPLSLAQRCSGVQAPLPLFNSLLNYRHSPGGADQQSVWEGIRWISGEERTNYPLSLDIDDSGQGFELTVQSRGEVAPERIMAYVETALKGIVTALCSAPDTLIQQVDILPASEREQILTDFNATTVAYPSDRLPHQLFEQQVARAPEAIALRYGDEELSYDELNCQANRLAHHLISLGVCPDDRVALCATRSSEMVVGLLAILKAGGAYVPLDPNYPPERLSYMLADSAPVVVVTQSNLLEMLPELSVPVLVLDETKVQSMLATQSMHNPSAEILGLNPSHLAYVIYTSGSTGLPKGVMIEHRGLVNYSLDAIRQFELTAADSVLQQNSLNFDLSLEEMLPTLLAGASLVLARDLFGSSSQCESCDDTVSVVHLTAAHWHSLVGQWSEVPARALRDLHGVRLLNVTGDALSVQKLQAWAEIRPAHTHLINTYGPTEATVSCTATRLSDGARSVTIGKPFANTRMYILDVHGQLAPVSVAGELYIGGVQVGRGYLNRPELTAERFIADPFSNKAGARLYKTGDLGRWLPDGNIEYLGRNDFQVKIRGFRIELGEIEARLAACDGVREAVVVAREDAPGDKRLVAYLVPQAGMGLDAATLRAELSTSLADYMLPGAFVGLEALPLTPNGKLDRQALPAPDQSAVVTRQYEAPQGKLEQQLAQIWQDLLGVEHIGRHDNFFELGGHSLLAMSLVARLRQSLDTEIVLGDIFTEKTISQLAISIQSDCNSNQYPNLFPIRTGGKDIPLFFVHAGGGSISYAYDLVTWMDDISIPVYGFSAGNLLEKEAKDGSLVTIQMLAESYIKGMLHVQPVGPYRIAAWSSGGVIAYEMARQLIAAGKKMDFIGLIDTDRDYKQFYPEYEKPNGFVFDEMAKLIEVLSTLDIPNVVINKSIELAKNKDYTAVLQLVKENSNVKSLPEYSFLKDFLLVCHNMDVASYHYCPPKLPTMITLFSAMDENDRSDFSLGWGNLIFDGLLRIVPLRGTHSSIMKKPYISHLGKELLRIIKTKGKSG